MNMNGIIYNQLIENYFSKDIHKKIFDYVVGNKNILEKNKKMAFSSTYKTDEIPDFLSGFIHEKYNLYHFVGIQTLKGAHIAPHIDAEVHDYMKKKDPLFIIGYPEVIVYYADVCEDMVGGDLITNGETIRPITNSAIVLPKNQLHEVTEVKDYKRPRTVLICERYRIIEKYLNKIDTPIHECG
tara:strand:- start:6129 stop:6680 length:552 start_codon:yes stop_codon:yes gene_type:complete